MKVLDFDGSWGPAGLQGNNGNTLITPMVCRTASHTAGLNEVAIVSFHGTASPSVATSDLLYIDVMISQNGAAFTTALSGYSAEGFGDGTAHASVTKRIPLVQGTSYVFGSGFGSNNVMNASVGYCQGTVTIAKL